MTRVFFFDTNFLYDETLKVFFGNQKELKEFSKYGDILIPDIVMEERICQIRKRFQEEQDEFSQNIFSHLLEINIEDFDIEKEITTLRKKDFLEFKYKIVNLENTMRLYDIKKFALERFPPFEKGKTDKGFKDCYLYFTIIEYIKNNPNYEVFVISKDKMLKEAFTYDWEVSVIESFSEFKTLIDKTLQEKLKNIFPEEESKIMDIWKTLKGNMIVSVLSKTQGEIRVLIDGNKFIDKLTIANVESGLSLSDMVSSLCNSGSFRTTHHRIAKITPYIEYLSSSEICKILESSVNNDQIRSIIEDSDVAQFIFDLFHYKKNDLSLEIREEIWRMLPLPF